MILFHAQFKFKLAQTSHAHMGSIHPVTVSTHWDCLRKLKQAEEKDPPSCAKCFEQQLETVKGCIGSAFTDGFAEQMPEHKA